MNITIDLSSTISGHLPNQIDPQALAGLVAVSLRRVPEARGKAVNFDLKRGLVINGSRNLAVTEGRPVVGEKIVRMGWTAGAGAGAGAGVTSAGVADAGTAAAFFIGENKESAAKVGTKRKAEEMASLSFDEGTQSNALMSCRSQLPSPMRKRENATAIEPVDKERRVLELYVG